MVKKEVKSISKNIVNSIPNKPKVLLGNYLLDLIHGPTVHKTCLGEWYSIRIEGKKEFIKFSKLFGSGHIDKLQRMQTMVKKIEKSSRS